MKQILTVIAMLLFLSPSVLAQEGVFCVDLLKLMPRDVQIDTTQCGLYLEQMYCGDLAQCNKEELLLPHWGDNNRELGRFIKSFPCDKIRGVDAPQRGQLRFVVEPDGNITSISIRNMHPRLSAHLEYYFKQMDRWTPGQCAGAPCQYVVDLILQYYPGKSE